LTGREGLIQNAGQQKGRGDTGLHGSILLPNGDVVVNQFYVGTAQLNSCGETLWTLPEGSHHSVAQAEDGSFWITAVSQEKHDSYPGLGPVWVDRILHVSEKGKIISDINTLDILYENDLERFLFQHGKTAGDVTHQNDVEPLPPSLSGEYPLFNTGDLLISARNINLVFVFDPDTERIKWYSRDPFIGQHDPDFIGDGWIGVFDNNSGRGAAMGMGSWVRAFQPHTDSTRVLFQPDRIDRFYTNAMGKWQHLENGNMLLTESETGRAVEVDPEGRIVWEWIHKPTEDGKIPSITKATRVDLTREEVASWPCSSVDSISTSAQKQ